MAAGAAVGSVILGRALLLSSSAEVRGVAGAVMENSKLPLGTTVAPRAGLKTITGSSSTTSSSLSRRGIHSHLRSARFDTTTTGAAFLSNSAFFRRSAQVERHLNPRPWIARRTLSTNPTAPAPGPPGNSSFVAELIQKVVQFFASLLPSKTFFEKVEAEVDAASAMVQEGAKIVSHVADEVENVANAAEMKAEEVEKLAQKVEDASEKIQKAVDDVANVIEGEEGSSSLAQSVEQLKKVAAVKRAQESDPAVAANTATASSNEK